jgi:hypothetical protein
LLLAVAPHHTSTFLPYIPVSTMLSTCEFDITFTRSTILLTKSHQPKYYSLIGCTSSIFVDLGTAFGLAGANIVQQKLGHRPQSMGYAPAFWLAIAFATCGLSCSAVSRLLRRRDSPSPNADAQLTGTTLTDVEIASSYLSSLEKAYFGDLGRVSLHL